MVYRKNMVLILHFLLSVLVAFTLASVSHSLFVILGLSEFVSMGPAQWGYMLVMDWWGLLPGYGAIITVALLLGFSIMHGLNRLFSLAPSWSMPLAGVLAFITMFWGMYQIFELTLIAGANTVPGYLLQLVCGGVAGHLFYRLRSR